MQTAAGIGDHIGRIEAAAEPHFEHERIGRMTREGEERRRRRDLEKGDGLVAVGALAFFQHRRQVVLGDQPAGDADALVKAHEMRRGVDVHAVARAFQHGAQIGADRALAVGAGDMDDRRQFAFGMAELGEQPLDAVEHEIDALGMKREQPFEDGIARRVRLDSC